MNSPIFAPILRLACCCLSLGLLALLIGCGKNPHVTDHAEVSGKVLFQGKPLPGGRVNFITVVGAFASSANIDENGQYQVKAPVGEVQISVTNEMLKSNRASKGKGSPKLKKAEAQEHQTLKGRWVQIPTQYKDPLTSGLKYTVKPGKQTHDIELSANPSPVADASRR